MPNTVIDWQQDWRNVSGIPIKSAVSGHIFPLHQHPLPFFKQVALTTAVACKLEHGIILSPFAGLVHLELSANRRISFRHQSGLTMIVELPFTISKMNGKGLHWLVRNQQTVAAGQPVLQLDLSFLQMALELEDVWIIIHLSSPLPIESLYCRKAKLIAGIDALFMVQLKKS